MVDSTSTKNLVKQDIINAQDSSRVDNAADKWWSNMLAVIKLRQKGKTMVSKLPLGVFRHMLEYKIPKSWRYSQPFMVIKGKQDRNFPVIDKLNYNNFLVAVNEL